MKTQTRILVYDLLTGSSLGGIEYKGSVLSALDGNKLVNYDLEGNKLDESTLTGLTAPKGITNLGGTAYILDGTNIVPYTNKTKGTAIPLQGITNVVDITNDGTYLYVATATTKTIYAFDPTRRIPERDVQLHAELSVTGIAYADNLLHVTTSNGHVFHYAITEIAASSVTTNAIQLPSSYRPRGVSVIGDHIAILENNGDDIRGYSGRGTIGRYTDLDYDFSQDTPNEPDAIHGMDVDGYTAYVINRNSSATSDLHKVFVYDIRPFIKKMLDIQFNITTQTIRNVRKTLNMKFGIEQVVNKTLNVKFNLEQIVRKTLNVKFDLWHHVPKTLNMKFNMLKTILPKNTQHAIQHYFH